MADRLLAAYGIEIEMFDAEQARVAAQAYRDYGRGSGHRARLNLGDSYSYALAHIAGEPRCSLVTTSFTPTFGRR